MTTQLKSNLRDWAKQLAVCLAITALIPLTVWYGAAAFHAPPDEAEYERVRSRLESQIADAKDPPAKDKLYAEKQRTEKRYDDAEEAFYRRRFWLAYPIGLLTFAVGIVLPVQPVGAGLMFGGLCALTAGCYSAWDALGRWLHFGSLIVALLFIIFLSLWRFRDGRQPRPSGSPVPLQ